MACSNEQRPLMCRRSPIEVDFYERLVSKSLQTSKAYQTSSKVRRNAGQCNAAAKSKFGLMSDNDALANSRSSVRVSEPLCNIAANWIEIVTRLRERETPARSTLIWFNANSTGLVRRQLCASSVGLISAQLRAVARSTSMQRALCSLLLPATSTATTTLI